MPAGKQFDHHGELSVVLIAQEMFRDEPICQKVAIFLSDELAGSTMKIDNRDVPEEDKVIYSKFLADSIEFYLVYGFVPFRLRKIDSRFFPFVISPDLIEFEYSEQKYEDIAPNVQVDFAGGLQTGDKKPRIYVYTFNNNECGGVLKAAMTEYSRLIKTRMYQQDYMDLNRSSVVFLQRQKSNENASDYGKMNVNQILSVSDQFRVNMDSSIRDCSDLESEKERTRQIKHEVDSQSMTNPSLEKFCVSVSLPENSSGHLFQFRPPAVSMDDVTHSFNDSIMDCLHLPRSWGGVGKRDRQNHGNYGDNETRSGNKVDDDGLRCGARICQDLSRMMSFVLSLINDKSFHSKLAQSEQSKKEGRRMGTECVNLVNLYMRPSCVFSLEKPATRDVSFLLDMYQKNIISHSDFSDAFQHATGMAVDPAAKKMRTAEYDAKITGLSNDPVQSSHPRPEKHKESSLENRARKN